LKLSVEARFQIDRKNFRFRQIDLDPTTNETIPLTTFRRTWHRFLPTALPTRSIPISRSMAGSRPATGRRFQPEPRAGFFDRVPYNPEDITSGEIGVKGRFRIGSAVFRSQLAVYYSVTRNVQQTTTLSATNPAFTLENVGTDDIFGGEFELTAPFRWRADSS
jgi:hypothetical protein